MSNVYRTMSSRARPPSPWGKAALRALLVMGAVGVCVLGVWWFRRQADARVPEAVEETAAEAAEAATVAAQMYDAECALQPVNGAAASGGLRRSHLAGVYAVSLSAQLPAIDPAASAYEAWFVKPGITDFFSLGEMYPLAEGGWGLLWSQTDALARNDIEEFYRIIIIREPRDGNAAPSADQVLTGACE